MAAPAAEMEAAPAAVPKSADAAAGVEAAAARSLAGAARAGAYLSAAADALFWVLLVLLLVWLVARAAGWGRKCPEVSCRPRLNRSQRDLASDVPGHARTLDAGARDTWGVAQARALPDDDPLGAPLGFVPRFWAAQNGAASLTLYDAAAGTVVTQVAVPPGVGGATGLPSGVVVPGPCDPAFLFSDGGPTGAARVIVVTEDGTIAAYSPDVDALSAVTVVDSSAAGKVFKGAAIAGGELFVAEYATGFIEVYSPEFALVRSFTDTGLAAAGYAPHNVLALPPERCGGQARIAVAFAAQDATHTEAVPGVGSGYIDIFLADGTLERRLVNQGALDAPWGLALSGCALLVGNHGDGRINAFDRGSGSLIGPMRDKRGNPLAVDGLWGLAPLAPCKIPCVTRCTPCPQRARREAKAASDPALCLFFAAGPAAGADGLFGRLKPA